jgi:hypothetical protein
MTDGPQQTATRAGRPKTALGLRSSAAEIAFKVAGWQLGQGQFKSGNVPPLCVRLQALVAYAASVFVYFPRST